MVKHVSLFIMLLCCCATLHGQVVVRKHNAKLSASTVGRMRSAADGMVNVYVRLAEGADTARNFGISEHARLADIAWADEPPSFPEVFRRPAEPCELWRERTFAVTVREGGKTRRLVGQFDRVHIFPDSRRAVIYDFKTSREPVATSAYERQLRDYRVALAALTGFAPESIRMVLLFTRSGRSVEVADA